MRSDVKTAQTAEFANSGRTGSDGLDLSDGIESPARSGAAIAINVGRGAIALSLAAVLTIIGQLAIVPIAMRSWGPARWGEWVALSAFVSLLPMADLGLQTYVVNELCTAYARNERGKLLSILHSAFKVDSLLAGTVLIVMAIILPLLPLAKILGLKTITGFQLIALLLLLASDPLINTPMGVVTGLYRATGRIARGAMLGNAKQASILAITILFVWADMSLLSLGVARAAISLAVLAWVIVDLRILYPWVHIWPKAGKLAEGIGMIVPGLFFLLIPVANYLSNELILIIIQRVLGGTEVSHYGTHQTAVNFARMLSTLLTWAAWPELTMLYAHNDLERAARAHRILAKWNFWLAGAATGIVIVLLPLIYGVWTQQRLVIDSLTLAILAVRITLWGCWSGSMTILLAINRQQIVGLALGTSALIAGALALVLVPRMGISGAALALLIGDLSVPLWLLPLAACKAIDDTLATFLTEACATPLVTLGITGTVMGLIWVTFADIRAGSLAGLAVGMLTGSFFWVCSLNESERNTVVALGRSTLSKARFLLRMQDRVTTDGLC